MCAEYDARPEQRAKAAVIRGAFERMNESFSGKPTPEQCAAAAQALRIRAAEWEKRAMQWLDDDLSNGRAQTLRLVADWLESER